MSLGLIFILIYVAYNVAAYGAPEFKVLGVAITIIVAVIGAAKNIPKKAKVGAVSTDKYIGS